jgi:hypothetical protein
MDAIGDLKQEDGRQRILFRLTDHLHEDSPGTLCILYFSRKRHSSAVNSVTRFEPEMKAQAVDGGYRRLIGIFAGKSARDQTQSVGMIIVHMPNDLWRGFGQRIR